MQALVIYETLFGNTREIAQAIGVALSERYAVRVLPIAEVAAIPPVLELLLVAGPTHRHSVSQAMRTFLDGMPRGAL